MKRIYGYKGFEVTVELEALWQGTARKTWLMPPEGFVAVVSICIVGAARPVFAPIRLTRDSHRPFATESDALMAGYSAGQRVVDDMLTTPRS